MLLHVVQTATDSLDTLSTGSSQAGLSFIDLLIKGGVILIPLGILSVISIYLIFERYFYIKKASYIDKQFMRNVKESLLRGDFNAALMLCRSSSSALSNVVERGIMRIGRPIEEIESNLETAGHVEIAKMENNLNYLGIIAGIAPMLGFIGTIVGIIKIFYDISLSDNISIGIIAGGLYQKMITSCAGLVVGVVAYGGYHFLNILIEKFSLTMETIAMEFMDVLHEPTKV